MKTAKLPPARRSSPEPLSAGQWLQALLVQIAHRARADAIWMQASPELATHRLRKRMKKLQALLLLAEPVQGDDAMASMREGIRGIKNALAARRDADVLSTLRQKLGVAQTVGRSARIDWELLNASLDELLASVERMDLKALNWAALTKSHLKTCRLVRNSWKKARQHATEKRLHSWRKRVKEQYHQALALHPWLGQSGRLRRIRRLGSLLGRCHDLDVFEEKLNGSKENNKLRHKVGSRRKKLQQRIFRRAERIFSSPMSKTRHRVRTRLPAQSR